MPKSRADFLAVQETKRVGHAGAAGVVRAARAAGWNCSASPALRGETDLGSGGCAVAARRGIGVREPDDVAISSALAHRFHLAKVSALTKGGFYLATLYLQDAVGLNDYNISLLQEVAWILRSLAAPWILTGDFNLEPSTLVASNFLELCRGQVVAPKLATCHNSVYDFCVVSERLAHAVAGVARIEDAFLHFSTLTTLYGSFSAVTLDGTCRGA